ncbi:type 1 glutamine amidotransferase domain-containing protein [Enhygromyxa salina]|uniref:Putative cysteine protease YraA n=1 Tax=Enhygromyxa salina TaxID=215803 RepID=A0A2S9YD95_9BACT|nr:type 1 glutamine amidotransferase domain-containing protein [Enhygromyxa salina]PRQ03090.1 putative cysteine protease YraA [Enhygromyxa salina]
MTEQLENKKIAILATDGFEQSELDAPKRAYIAERAEVDIISIDSQRSIRGWAETKWGDMFEVDRCVPEAKAADYDALLIPGGLFNPDKMRQSADALEFVRNFATAGKPIAAICHGPWVLINADLVNGRRMTSYPSIRRDLENAGATWVDEEVVTDDGLITSRSPDDMEAFLRATIAGFRDAQGVRGSRAAP